MSQPAISARLRARALALSGNTRGAAWLLISALGFSVMNALIKQLGAELHAFEIAFFRCLFGFLVILPFALGGGWAAVRPVRPGLHILRAGVGLSSMLAIFYALTQLPLATATALFFAKPLFMIVLAVLFLGETVRWRRWLATAIGFAGVVVMLRPVGVAEPAVLAALYSSFSVALVMVLVKTMTRTETPTSMLLFFSLAATIGALPPALFVWQAPTAWQLLVLAVIGVMGTAGQYFAVRAYRVGEATVVTPVDYTQLLFAALFGFFVFAEVPDGWTVSGALIIAASTLYILRREARLGRKPPPP